MTTTSQETEARVQALRAAIEAEHAMPEEWRAIVGGDFPPTWWVRSEGWDDKFTGLWAAYSPLGPCYDAVRTRPNEPPCRVAVIQPHGGCVHVCDEWTAIEFYDKRLSVESCEGGHRWVVTEIHQVGAM